MNSLAVSLTCCITFLFQVWCDLENFLLEHDVAINNEHHPQNHAGPEPPKAQLVTTNEHPQDTLDFTPLTKQEHYPYEDWRLTQNGPASTASTATYEEVENNTPVLHELDALGKFNTFFQVLNYLIYFLNYR